MRVGNLAVKRDFLDVRDVASAYAKAIALSDRLPTNNVFNLASGIPRAINELLDVMLSCTSIKIEKQVDPALQRSNEIETIAGDYSNARAILNWSPNTSEIHRSRLREMVESCTNLEVAAGATWI